MMMTKITEEFSRGSKYLNCFYPGSFVLFFLLLCAKLKKGGGKKKGKMLGSFLASTSRGTTLEMIKGN